MQSNLEIKSAAEAIRATTPPMGAALTCQVLNTFAGNDHLRALWDETVAGLNSTIYMTYDWCRTWWEFYGQSKELKIAIFRMDEHVVGILPMYIERIGFGPLCFRVARLLGANIPPKIFDPPVSVAHARDVFAAMIDELISKERCDLVSVGPLSEEYGPADGFCKACDARPDLTQALSPAGVYTVVHLPAKYDDYVKGLRKKERYYLRKDETQLFSKELAGVVDSVSEPDKTGPEFEAFADQHARQWTEQGRAGHFGSWPEGLAYNKALVERLSPLGRVRFVRIVTNKGIISRQYAFAFGSSYFWELPSRETGPEWDTFSLGRTGAATMFRVAIEEGKTRIEAGTGSYDYKKLLNATEYRAVIFRVRSARLAARVRHSLFTSFAWALRVVYHKIWYRRIMPRLPVRWRRPQWKLWLTFDF